MKDAEDLKLEALFAAESIPDNGFSERIEKRIRRQIWVRRLALPAAVLIGGLIAAKPLSDLLIALLGVANRLPSDLGDKLGLLPTEGLPSMTTFALGAMLAVAAVVATRMLED